MPRKTKRTRKTKRAPRTPRKAKRTPRRTKRRPRTPHTPPGFVTRLEAMKLLGLRSRNSVRRLESANLLHPVRADDGRSWLLPRHEIDAFNRARGKGGDAFGPRRLLARLGEAQLGGAPIRGGQGNDAAILLQLAQVFHRWATHPALTQISAAQFLGAASRTLAAQLVTIGGPTLSSLASVERTNPPARQLDPTRSTRRPRPRSRGA